MMIEDMFNIFSPCKNVLNIRNSITNNNNQRHSRLFQSNNLPAALGYNLNNELPIVRLNY